MGEDPTAWFERLYVAAEHGDAVVPWDREGANPRLVRWAETAGVRGDAHRAVVVGCGFGGDAEYVAGLGYDTIGFDAAPTAIRAAQRRFPDSHVQYRVADLLDLPARWHEAFDLVVESLTVQSLPVSLHEQAIEQVVGLVAPGGTLLVLAAARDEADGEPPGPPWPLTRAELERFATGGLASVRIEELHDPEPRWRAEFRYAI